MRMEYFEYLIEIAKQKNMKVSSERLHMTPQALSVCIKNMEREVGFEILERKPKGVELTADGQTLLSLAERIVKDYYQTLQEIHQSGAAFSSQEAVQIYATPIVAMCIGGSLIDKCQRQYPHLTIDVLNCNESLQEMVARIQEAEQKNVISVLTIAEEVEHAVQEQLPETIDLAICFDDEVVLAAAKSSALAKKGQVTAADLQGQTFIHCTEQFVTATPIRDIFEGLEAIKHIRCNSINLWGKMIGNDLGIGPIIKRALQQAFREGDISREKISAVTLETQPMLRCICLSHRDAPEYVKRMVLEIRQL